jgi:hypothetical protein
LEKGLGNLLKVDDLNGAKTTFKSFLRILVEIEVDNPLKPSFPFRIDGGDSLWIFLKYEWLDIYCSSCGRIGHKSANCMATPEKKTPDRYAVSLKVNIFSNLLPSSPTSSTNPSINISQTQPSNPHTSAMVLNKLSGARLSPNPLSKPLLNLIQPVSSSKQLEISPPKLISTIVTSQPISSSLNATINTFSIASAQDTTTTQPTKPHIHPTSQLSKQPFPQPPISLDHNQVIHGHSLSIILPFSSTNPIYLPLPQKTSSPQLS